MSQHKAVDMTEAKLKREGIDMMTGLNAFLSCQSKKISQSDLTW